MSASAVPNPGSIAAKMLGCKCPVIDNHHGRGRGTYEGETVFVYNLECPIHCPPSGTVVSEQGGGNG